MITNENKFKSIEQLRRILIFLSALSVAMLAYFNTKLAIVYVLIASLIITITVLTLVYHALIGFAYFAFEQIGDVLIFKYYATGNFSFKRMKISVSQTDFAGYELHQSFFNRHKKLLISEWLDNRKATYSPLSISYLSANEQNQLIHILQNSSAK